jgi:PleD family two-component response regulator
MEPGETLTELTARADAALKRAKDNGRDRVELALREGR